jgi:hypothetical protein
VYLGFDSLYGVGAHFVPGPLVDSDRYARGDIQCECTNTDFQSELTSCLEANCSPSDQQAATQLQQSQCAAGEYSQVHFSVSPFVVLLNGEFIPPCYSTILLRLFNQHVRGPVSLVSSSSATNATSGPSIVTIPTGSVSLPTTKIPSSVISQTPTSTLNPLIATSSSSAASRKAQLFESGHGLMAVVSIFGGAIAVLVLWA